MIIKLFNFNACLPSILEIFRTVQYLSGNHNNLRLEVVNSVVVISMSLYQYNHSIWNIECFTIKFAISELFHILVQSCYIQLSTLFCFYTYCEKIKLNYSLKDIPIPDDICQVKLTEKIESILKRMCWKAHFFLNQSEKQNNVKTTYGFKSRLCLQQHPNVEVFDKNLFDIVKSIKLRKVKDAFQIIINQTNWK